MMDDEEAESQAVQCIVYMNEQTTDSGDPTASSLEDTPDLLHETEENEAIVTKDANMAMSSLQENEYFTEESFNNGETNNVYLCSDGNDQMAIIALDQSQLQFNDQCNVTFSVDSDTGEIIANPDPAPGDDAVRLDDELVPQPGSNVLVESCHSHEKSTTDRKLHGAQASEDSGKQPVNFLLVMTGNSNQARLVRIEDGPPTRQLPDTLNLKPANPQTLDIRTSVVRPDGNRIHEGRDDESSIDEGQIDKAQMVRCRIDGSRIVGGRIDITEQPQVTRTSRSSSPECNICGRTFKCQTSLNNHLNIHSGFRPHKCLQCSSAFTTSGELSRHTRYKHTFEKPHHCSECEYTAVEMSKLKRHMRSHTGEKPYHCSQCTYRSADTYRLKRHMLTHTGQKPYKCDICHSRFTQSNSLKVHRRSHLSVKPMFRCTLCPTTCGRKNDLRIHIQKQHSSQLDSYRCKKCTCTFNSRYSYKLHARSHEGDKAYRCRHCQFSSIRQDQVVDHVLVSHSELRSYNCLSESCNESFRFRCLLEHHRLLNHTEQGVNPLEKTFICSCLKSFSISNNMSKHYSFHSASHLLSENATLGATICLADDAGIDAALDVAETEVLILEMTENRSDSNSEAKTRTTSTYQEFRPDGLVLRRVTEHIRGHKVVVMQLGPPDDDQLTSQQIREEHLCSTMSDHISDMDQDSIHSQATIDAIHSQATIDAIHTQATMSDDILYCSSLVSVETLSEQSPNNSASTSNDQEASTSHAGMSNDIAHDEIAADDMAHGEIADDEIADEVLGIMGPIEKSSQSQIVHDPLNCNRNINSMI